MKRTERRHLKENELDALARQARELVENRTRETTFAIAAIVIVGAAVLGYIAWRDRTQTRAAAMLASAMAVADTRVGAPIAPGTPGAGPSFLTDHDRLQAALPKFKSAADAYPSTEAGIFARYQEGSTAMAMGDAKSAAAAYQEVIDRAGDGIYGQMARLGLAEAQASSGQYEQAINAFRELAQRKDGPLPIDGILMELGRTYASAGKPSDAQQTFNRVVEEFPDSAFNAEAKKELDSLKKG